MRLAMLMLAILGFATVVVAALIWWVPVGQFAVPAAANPPVAAAPPAAAGSPEAPARADSCSGRDLRVRKQDLRGGTGRLVLTNTGRRPCTVQGYPVIEAVQAGHVALRSEPVPVPAGDPGELIPLKPEQSASAAYLYIAGQPDCPEFDRTQVLVPHTAAPFPLTEIGSGLRPGLRPGQRICGYRVQSLIGGAGATWKPS